MSISEVLERAGYSIELSLIVATGMQGGAAPNL